MPTFPSDDDRLVLEPDCRRCPALVEDRECISWGNGPRDAAVLVVGEAPGAGDPDADRWRGGNWTGKAYTSRHSGRRIRDLVADAGVDRAFFTNAVKCFPSDGDGGNREPTDEERATCRDHLEREVEIVDPAVVLATGRHATESLLSTDGRSLDGFVDRVLDPIAVDSLAVTVVPLLHPSYQDVWLGRLGYDRAEYVAELRAVLADYGVVADDCGAGRQ